MSALAIPHPVGPDQIWRQVRTTGGDPAPLLCLDRDGVVIEEGHYLSRVDDVRFIDGAVAVIRRAHAAGWRVALVTNQAGIARGYFGWDDFAAVNRYLLDWLDARGARIDAVYATPHHTDGIAPWRHPDHPMRKPNPGMLLAAAQALQGDLARSLMVGDKADDLRAAQRAGLPAAFHVLTGHGRDERALAATLDTAGFRVHCIDHLGDPRLMAALQPAGAVRLP